MTPTSLSPGQMSQSNPRFTHQLGTVDNSLTHSSTYSSTLSTWTPPLSSNGSSSSFCSLCPFLPLLSSFSEGSQSQWKAWTTPPHCPDQTLPSASLPTSHLSTSELSPISPLLPGTTSANLAHQGWPLHPGILCSLGWLQRSQQVSSALPWGSGESNILCRPPPPPTCVPPCLTSDPSVVGFLLHWGEFQTAKLSTALSLPTLPSSSFDHTEPVCVSWMHHGLSHLLALAIYCLSAWNRSSSIRLTPQPCAILGVKVWAVVLLRQSFDCVLQSTLHTHSGWVYL